MPCRASAGTGLPLPPPPPPPPPLPLAQTSASPRRPANKSAVVAAEKELREKERVIRENIARRLQRIHEVERQVQQLQNQLHVNVAPRQQALEHLRHRVEEQNRIIDKHRAAFRKAQAAMQEAAAALAAAEAQKARLSDELTMLVTQSAGAQLRVRRRRGGAGGRREGEHRLHLDRWAPVRRPPSLEPP